MITVVGMRRKVGVEVTVIRTPRERKKSDCSFEVATLMR